MSFTQQKKQPYTLNHDVNVLSIRHTVCCSYMMKSTSRWRHFGALLCSRRGAVCGQLTSPPQPAAANVCWELRSRPAHPSAEVDSAAISLPLMKNRQRGGGRLFILHNYPDTWESWLQQHVLWMITASPTEIRDLQTFSHFTACADKTASLTLWLTCMCVCVCVCVSVCSCVSHGGKSAGRQPGRRHDAREDRGRWEHICAGSGQPGAACALRRYRMQRRRRRRRRRRGSDCRGAGWHRAASGHKYPRAAVWVQGWYLIMCQVVSALTWGVCV